MSKYDLLLGVTAAAAVTTKPQGQSVTPPGPINPNMPPQEQAFQLAVVGVGLVSATVQLLVSNDTGPDPSLFNWSPYGDPFTATGTPQGNATVQMNGSWRHFGAACTAISGTNATAQLRMSA